MSDHHALLALVITLLGTLVLSTWRFASLATSLTGTIHNLEKKDAELEARIKVLDTIPALAQRVGQIEQNHSIVPAALSRILVLEQQSLHSKEMRRVLMRQSQPDKETDE